MDNPKTYGPDTGLPVRLANDALIKANTLGDLIYDIDRALVMLGQRLDELQPPHEGRLFIRWDQKTGAPRVARWRRRGKDHWRIEYLPRGFLSLRASSKGLFARTYLDVRQILDQISPLLELRTRVLQAFANFTRASHQLDKHHSESLQTFLSRGLPPL